MKKINSNKVKIVWGSLGAGILLVPTVAISAVACSSEKDRINKPAITISVQPKNEMIFLNQPENLPTLSVNATTSDANAQLTYQWYENDTNSTTNGKPISGATQSTYTIPKSYTQEAGTKYFYVVINVVVNNNILNSEISNISTLTITNSVPAIVVQTEPKSQEGIIGQTQNLPTFSVVASAGNADEKLTYQWYYNTTDSTSNGTIINDAINSSYTITTTDIGSSAETKYFYVKIGGTINGVKLNPIISKTASLTIKAKPPVSIATQPVNQVAYINQTEKLPSFNVVVTPINNAIFTYQWYSNTSNSNSGGTLIQGATNSSYQVPTADVGAIAATKYYYVIVSGTLNGVALTPVTSSPASLTVKALPTIVITTQPTAQTVHANQNADFPSFSVVVTPIDNAELTYQWYSNTTNSTTGGTAIKGATKASYETSASDIGTSAGSIKYFYVSIGGSIGNIELTSINSNVVTLTTQAASAITISAQPTPDQVVAKDASITLNVTATSTGAKPLTYQWQKSNKVQTDPVWTNVEGANAPTYTFNAANDPGIITYYRVIISETITDASTISNEAKVSVGYADAAAATTVLNAWLSNKDNQKNLLNSYFAKPDVNPLSIFVDPTNTSHTGSAFWTYRFNSLPTATLNSITFAEATTDNTLPADTWEIKATTKTAGTYQIWNNTSNSFGESIQIPIGTVFTFYLPFSFKEDITVTTTANASLVAHITRTISLTNNSSALSFATDARIPANKIQGSFTPSDADAATVNFSFSNPTFYSFSNTNSDLPTYPIVTNSSSR